MWSGSVIGGDAVIDSVGGVQEISEKPLAVKLPGNRVVLVELVPACDPFGFVGKNADGAIKGCAFGTASIDSGAVDLTGS
jgi:hypothetical protein